MPATALTTDAPCLTLVEAARLVFPHARGNSGYYRLYMMIKRHRCPVKFSYAPGRRGSQARYLRREDLPVLNDWVKELTNGH